MEDDDSAVMGDDSEEQSANTVAYLNPDMGGGEDLSNQASNSND